jgi:DNA-binding transcriptional ArsR family regulator
MTNTIDMGLLATRFAALGDSTRLAIVERLLARGALSAGELGDVAKISAPAISRHLKVLREAGIITQTIDRQRRIYAVAAPAVQAISDWTKGHEAFWMASVERLDAALKQRE